MKKILLEVIPTNEECFVHLRNSKGDFIKYYSGALSDFIVSCPDDATVQPTDYDITVNIPTKETYSFRCVSDLNKWFAEELERRWNNIPKINSECYSLEEYGAAIEMYNYLKQQLLNPKP